MGEIQCGRSHSASRAPPASMTGPPGHRSHASRSRRSLFFVDIRCRSIGLPAQVPGGRSAFRLGLNKSLLDNSLTAGSPVRACQYRREYDLFHTRGLGLGRFPITDSNGPSPRLAKKRILLRTPTWVVVEATKAGKRYELETTGEVQSGVASPTGILWNCYPLL